MTTVFLAVALVVAAPAPKDKKPDPGPIEGEWVIQSYVLGGREDNIERGEKVRLSEGFLVVGENEKVRYTLDSKADPPRIDMTPVRGKHEPILGIYKLDGDSLVICFPKGGGADRPTKFESWVDSRIVVVTLKRETKEN
jgi:uncharacterized protein (TIGR03067 family)